MIKLVSPYILFLALSLLTLSSQAETLDTTRVVLLEDVEVVSSVKEHGGVRQQPSSVTMLNRQQMESARITSLKGVSSLAPNLYIPDYGSRLTSAIYIRGIGSRINTPAVGLYVDEIPCVDKSAFDFNFYDVENIEVLRGPQGTLYGHNTMGGLVRVHTKNPFAYQGSDIRLGYATGDQHRTVSATHYHRVSDRFAFSGGGFYEGGSGFFKNDLTGKRVDDQESGGARMRGIWLPNDRVKVDANLSYTYSDEGAYPYFYTGTLAGEETYPDLVGKISNNRENTYRRSLLNAGVNANYQSEHWQMSAITGYQNLRDRMFMDQDFLAPDIYTLEQKQRINTLTEEVVFKNKNTEKWERTTGAHLMYQWLHTDGPVNFYADGLRWLEGNINAAMPSIDRIPMLQKMGFTGMHVNFRGDQLLMNGDYETPTFGAAMYHQSTYHFTPHLSATLGLRLDYEHQQMSFLSPALVEYGFSMPNASPRMAVDLQDLTSSVLYEGTLKNDRFKLLPKVALKYAFDRNNNLYASVTKGLRSGGYNLQMFSDLLQIAMRADMMNGVQEGVGKYMDDLASKTGMPPTVPDMVRQLMKDNMPHIEAPSIQQVVYRPEYSWNYELGTHLTLLDRQLSVDASLFLCRIYDQQIARFAPTGFGRMMVNAGKSQSWGSEFSARWTPNKHWALMANYGYTRATFLDYDAGDEHDYSGNYVPFVPAHTLSADAAYTWTLRSKGLRSLSLGANVVGSGRIYWTESNDASQSFYAQMGARLALDTKYALITLWGKNLTNTHYNTFYFESAGRGFEQHGKPLHVGVDVAIHF